MRQYKTIPNDFEAIFANVCILVAALKLKKKD
jgi:hypothetical protein